MNIDKMNFRIDWIQELFLALNPVFVNVDEKLKTIDYYDVIFAKEQVEAILGIVFITAQTYITGTISDISAIRKVSIKNIKYEILSKGSRYVADKITQVELVNSIANYHKHNEEWDGWKINKYNKGTIEILLKCGITSETEFPCYETAKMLWPEKEMDELSNLIKILKSWREQVINECITSSAGNTYPVAHPHSESPLPGRITEDGMIRILTRHGGL